MINNEIVNKIKSLKSDSGTHSPSIESILINCPEISIDVDACFLSNPYATDLFVDYFNNDLIENKKLRNYLEFYPPQNRQIAKVISQIIGVDFNNIFVGNGAIEIIQAVLHRYVGNNLCIVLPTFSSYYEFVKPTTKVHYFYLQKEYDFSFVIEDYLKFIKFNNCDSAVLINPNNPNGGYIEKDQILYILEELKDLDVVILDESFIHFAYEGNDMANMSIDYICKTYPNLVLIKSMSKDFGIAGIRAGYALLSKTRVDELLSNGFLWNVSGLSTYFFQLYGNKKFQDQYEIVRKNYILNTKMFISELSKIHGIKVYSSKSNFVLVELLVNISSFDFTMYLLINYGVYIRDCSDKFGLEGQFIRIASRSFEENHKIIDSLKKCLNEFFDQKNIGF